MSTPPRRVDTHDARVISEHLPAGYSAAFDGKVDGAPPAGSSSSSTPDLTEIPGESSLKLQGGDIHRSLFKLDQRARMAKRSATFSYAPQKTAAEDDEEEHLTVAEQQQPGGFRREFIQSKRVPILAARIPVTRNFVEFLSLYGSFAGEDLIDSDDDDAIESDGEDEEDRSQQPNERRPLLGRRKSSKATKKGDAGTTKTFFTLIKAFIGTGIMFLPKAFNNGGILFSSICLVTISSISMLAFHLLLQCRNQCGGGGYGDIGGEIGGKRMRDIVLGSITLSQLGFVCAGVVFVAENLTSFAMAVSNSDTSPVSTRVLITLSCLVIVPLSFIRNISKLGPAALLADVFIMIGIIYIYYYDISWLSKTGIDSSVVLFNPSKYTLTIGSCIFTFEGIGLILPIQSSMSSPQKFEKLLATVMVIITIIFCSVGVLCYATFGSNTNIEVIDNFPQSSKLVNAVQFLYALAVLVGTPVQLFPPIRILENRIFRRATPGSKSTLTKWKKNAFRTFIVAFCGGVAILGANNLDRFVALIGSFACVPLVYIYPPLLHYWGVAETRWEKAGDIALIVLGACGMVYTTVVTVANSFLNQ